ncbi:hypothetical protein DYB26_013722 [Aphanomyces astaci]|uniref:Uncharacterized protein n=1 Tax=Aphanomyces astaci TaxID=112090 RepID=A0A418DXS0_APHAT|nr:hypothetical protein DYB26_013722 [Aphanomyces astaci]
MREMLPSDQLCFRYVGVGCGSSLLDASTGSRVHKPLFVPGFNDTLSCALKGLVTVLPIALAFGLLVKCYLESKRQCDLLVDFILDDDELVEKHMPTIYLGPTS